MTYTNLFNTANSPEEALNAIRQFVPIGQRNEIVSLVMAFFNAKMAEMQNEVSTQVS